MATEKSLRFKNLIMADPQSVCVVVGCRNPVRVSRKTGLPCQKCEHHGKLHDAQNKISYLKKQKQLQEMRVQSEAYGELVSTVNTLTDQLRACKAENDKLRQRLQKGPK